MRIWQRRRKRAVLSKAYKESCRFGASATGKGRKHRSGAAKVKDSSYLGVISFSRERP